MKQYLLDQVVKRGPNGEVWPQFPLIHVCGACHGVIGASWAANKGLNKEEAYEVALMQAGFYLHQWQGMNVANASIPVKKCDCRCQHNWKRVGSESGFFQCADCGVFGGGASDD